MNFSRALAPLFLNDMPSVLRVLVERVVQFCSLLVLFLDVSLWSILCDCVGDFERNLPYERA